MFSQNWSGEAEPVRAGQICAGRLRAVADTQGGAFVTLDSGQEVFLSKPDLAGVSLGAAINVHIITEARRDKLARGTLTTDAVKPFDAFQVWRDSVPDSRDLEVVSNPQQVASAFDEAGCETVGLDKGGRLHIERTRALTAIDVDSAGRIGKGSAGARALSLNRSAVKEAARQLALRDIGGAIVIDCVAPLNKPAGERLREDFLAAFRAVSARKVEVLAPSRFGLMEIALAWQACPYGEAATPPGEAELLDILRSAAHEAETDGAALLRIDLSPQAYEAYLERRDACDMALVNRFGGRLTVASSAELESTVRRR